MAMRHFPWRRTLRIVGRGIAILVAPFLVYLALALVLGLIPANAGWEEPPPAEGVTIFVNTNGVHTGIVMPIVNPVMDWRPYVPAEHLRDPRYGASSHIAIGYGNRDFYLNTPSWAELSVRTAIAASLDLGPALLHVDHLHDPQPGEEQRPIVLTQDQYRRLVDYIRPRFRLDDAGRTIPVLGRGYFDNDMFYEAHGGYSLILTCNEWTGRALRAAGVRVGLWTPFEQSVVWRFDERVGP